MTWALFYKAIKGITELQRRIVGLKDKIKEMEAEKEDLLKKILDVMSKVT